MPKIHRQKNHVRFYIPQALVDELEWDTNRQLAGEIGRDGELILTHDPSRFCARFFATNDYYVVTMPISVEDYSRRVRIESRPNKLTVKFF